MKLEQFVINEQTKKQFEQTTIEEILQQRAKSAKGRVIAYIKTNFPGFYDVCSDEIESAPAGWLNLHWDKSFVENISYWVRDNSPPALENLGTGKDGFGAPGVVIEEILFAVYRNSYCLELVVAKGNKQLGCIKREESNQDRMLAKILGDYFTQ